MAGYPYYGYPYYGYGYGYPYYGYPATVLGFSCGYGYPVLSGVRRYRYGSMRIRRAGSCGGVRRRAHPGRAAERGGVVDGAYVGIVDDFDGTFQHLDLEPARTRSKSAPAGQPLTYDVNVHAGTDGHASRQRDAGIANRSWRL